ncbi:MAG: hypothetical protein ABII82_16850 [Verrucomicrobiota bacterium]
MSDRLAELLRQKKLLQDHLNWLDQEIAQTATAAQKGPTPAAPASPAAAPVTSAGTPPPAPQPSPAPDEKPATAALTPVAEPAAGSPQAMRMADEIIARYQQEDALRPEDTKRGCLVLAGIVLLLMATAFLVSWWFFYRSRL